MIVSQLGNNPEYDIPEHQQHLDAILLYLFNTNEIESHYKILFQRTSSCRQERGRGDLYV
jgi:hypothetical protein